MAEQTGKAKYKNEKTVRLDVSADSKASIDPCSVIVEDIVLSKCMCYESDFNKLASIDPLLHTSNRHSLIKMHCLINHENLFILHYLYDVRIYVCTFGFLQK